MKITGAYELDADRETVWQALNDPDVLKACIPGCDSLEQTAENELTATVTAKVGPVKAKFNGAVTLNDLNPPESYRIEGSGKGGAAGFAKGGADVRLAERDGGGTLLTYEADAQVGGKLAQIGARLIDGTAKKLADQFFDNFRDHLANAAPATSAGEEASSPVETETTEAPDVTPEAPETTESATPATEPTPEPAAEPKAEPAAAAAPSRGVPAWVWFLGAAGLILVLVALVS